MVTYLECTRCGAHYPSERLQGLSECCHKPLYPRYHLKSMAFTPDMLTGRQASLWRYAEVLPVRDSKYRFDLGEGFTPLIDTPRLASELGVDKVWIKDEGQNPTGS